MIAAEAMGHPAKFSRGLIERIYRHLLRQGWLRPGDLAGDPFGGVALGAWPALRRGIHWVGVEIEPSFVALGRANLALWERRYSDRLPRWGEAALHQGDSRRLAEVLAGVEPGDLAGVISSPPYEGSLNQHPAANDIEARLERMRRAGIDVTNRANVGGVNGVARRPQRYGCAPGQVGAESGEAFWTAARLIVTQCHTLLKPGGVAVWVVKDFVRDKQRVEFAGQWRRLCEGVGFEPVEVIRAWLIEPGPTQLSFAGEAVDHTISRKSFFRRLHEKQYPHLAIDWETVLVMRR